MTKKRHTLSVKQIKITFTDEIMSNVEYVDTRKCFFPLMKPSVGGDHQLNQDRLMEIGSDVPGRPNRD